MSRVRKFSYVIFLKSVSYLRVSVEPNKKMLLLEVGFTEKEEKDNVVFLPSGTRYPCLTSPRERGCMPKVFIYSILKYIAQHGVYRMKVWYKKTWLIDCAQSSVLVIDYVFFSMKRSV